MSNGRVFYTDIDTVAGVSKNELYLRAKAFLATVFPDFKDGLKLDDKDLGEIRVRGFFSTAEQHSYGAIAIASHLEFYAITDIQVREGRYKYEIYEFIIPSSVAGVRDFTLEQYMYNRKRATKVSKELTPYMQRYIAALQAAMRKQAAAADNW